MLVRCAPQFSPIGIVEANAAAPITARSDVVKRAWKFKPEDEGHVKKSIHGFGCQKQSLPRGQATLCMNVRFDPQRCLTHGGKGTQARP